MAVTVNHPLDVEGRESTTHGEADNILVKEAHLYVTSWNGGGEDVVAIYSPGQWLTAVVERSA